MAILAAVLIPTVTNKIQDANEASANSTASTYANSARTDMISINSGLVSGLEVLELDADADAYLAVKKGSDATASRYIAKALDGATVYYGTAAIADGVVTITEVAGATGIVIVANNGKRWVVYTVTATDGGPGEITNVGTATATPTVA